MTERSTPIRWGAVAVMTAAMLAVTTACSTGGDTAPTASTANTITTRPTSPASPSATPESAAPSSSPGPTASSSSRAPGAPTGQCVDGDLAVTVQADPEGSGAGQRVSYVVFRNRGSAACDLEGAPGVSLVGDGDGTQIGPAASRTSDGTVVALAPGGYALAMLTYPAVDRNGGAFGASRCRPKAVDGYRVYPPHGYRAFFSRAADLYGCSSDLQNLRVTAVGPASRYPDFTPAS